MQHRLTLLLALWVTLLHAAYPEQTLRAEPALLQPVVQPAAVQRPLQSVSSLQPGFVPAADGYTASTQDHAVQLHSTGVSWHGRSGAIRMGFSGASPGQLSGLAPAHTLQQARGAESSQHLSQSSVRAYGLYPGVRVDYSLDSGRLRYDLHFAPGIAVSTVALQFDGVESLGLTDSGALRVQGPAGTVLQHPPRCYLESAEGPKPVPGRFVLLGEDRAGFVVEERALHQALVVDPTVDYISTVPLTLQEPSLSMAEDSAGRVWLAGTVLGTGGDEEAFVAQLQADGKGLQSVTYLGGSGIDRARSLHITEQGIWVAGYTESRDFPIRGSAWQSTYSGRGDGFVARLSPDGVLQWSSYVGGPGRDGIWSVSGAGTSLYLAGETGSQRLAGAEAGRRRGAADAFLLSFSEAGIAWVSRLGGSGAEVARSVSATPTGIWVAGNSSSTDLPVSQGEYGGGIGDGFVGLYSPQGRRQRLLYLGGPGQEQLNQVQADAGGAWLVGWSHASPSADRDGLLARLNSAGVLQWEQRIGGSGTDALYGVWGTAESAWVVGQGNSAELPVSADALQPVWGGGIDGLIGQYSASGSQQYLSYLGGSQRDEALAVSGSGATAPLWIAGRSYSADLPGLGQGMYVVRYRLSNDSPVFTSEPLGEAEAGRVYSYAATATDPDSDPLEYALLEGPAGMSVAPASGLVEWREPALGEYAVELEVTDDAGGSARQAWTLRVLLANRLPEFASEPVTLGSADTPYLYRAQATDPEGAALLYTLAAAPAGMSIAAESGTVTWPTPDQGNHSVRIVATDPRGGTAEQAWTLRIREQNRAPEFGAGEPPPAIVDLPYLYTPPLSDADGDAILLSLQSGPLGLSVADGAIHWRPATAGSAEVRLLATDALGAGTEQRYTLTTDYPAGDLPPQWGELALEYTVALGQTLSLQLPVIDESPLRYYAHPLPLPAGMVLESATGFWSYTPEAPGSYTLTLGATDERFRSERTVTLIVPTPDPTAPTRFQGRLLDANSMAQGTVWPIVEATVSILHTQVSARTDAEGNFTLSEIPEAESYILDLDPSSARPAPLGLGYAGFRERISLHTHVLNTEPRPFTLPRLAAESRTQINPLRDTMVMNEELGIELQVPAGMALAEDGSPYNGELWISEVPTGLAPAALPEFLDPGLLITIQPVGVRFAQPVPITFPNIDQLPAGTEVDIWSIDPEQGEFVVVGKGRVTSDEQRIETISGGIRAADWHAPVPEPPMPPEPPCEKGSPDCEPPPCVPDSDDCPPPPCEPGDPDCDECAPEDPFCNACEPGDPDCDECETGALICDPCEALGDCEEDEPEGNGEDDGEMPEKEPEDEDADKDNPSGCDRETGSAICLSSGNLSIRVKLPKYYSLQQGRRIELVYRSDTMQESHTLSFRARPSASGANPRALSYRMILGGQELGLPTYVTTLDAGRTTLRQGLHVRIPGLPTGRYTYEMLQGSHYAGGTMIGAMSSGQILLDNARSSVFGSGWRLQGLYHLHADAEGVVLEIPGSRPVYYRERSGGYQAPWGFFSQLLRTQDGYSHRKKNGTVRTFDTSGRLLQYQDRNGNSTRYIYDTAGRLERILDPVGLATVLRYHAGYLSSVEDPAHRVSYFKHDAHGRLLEVRYPDQSEEHYEYDVAHRLVLRRDERGHAYGYQYNAQGHAVGTELPDGSQRKVQDRMQTGLHEPGSGSLQSPMPGKASSAAGAFYVDARGHSERLVLDARSRPMLTQDAVGRSSLHVRDPDSNEVVTVRANGSRVVREYDIHGNVLNETEQFNRARTAYTYDAYSLLTSVVNPRGNRYLYQRDERGNLVTVTDPVGHVTQRTYNSQGLLERELTPNGLVREYYYNAQGMANRIVETPPANSPGSVRTTRIERNAMGLPEQVIQPDGVVYRLEYDARNRLLAIRDSLGQILRYTYDAYGNKIKQDLLSAGGGSIQSMRYGYDSRNRNVEIALPHEGLTESIFQSIWDAESNLIAQTDPNGAQSHYSYDAVNRLSHSTHRLSGITQYQYDELDRLIKVEAPNGTVTHYQYDPLGRRVQEDSPDRGRVLYRYGRANNLLRIQDGRGIDVRYSYDALERVVAVRYPNTHAGKDESVRYKYDRCTLGKGRLCEVQDESGLTRYQYDAWGNLVERMHTELGVEYVSRYRYDNGNQVIRQILSSGREIEYRRDALRRISGIRAMVNGAMQTVLEDIKYRADNNLEYLRYGNGLMDQRRYDMQGRQTSQQLSRASGVTLHSREHEYDANSNIVSLSVGDVLRNYDYDALDRVSRDGGVNPVAEFSYDQNNNRQSRITTDDSDRTEYSYQPGSNKLMFLERVERTDSITPSSRHVRRLEYNDAGRLWRVYQNDTLLAEYVYDGNGLRTRKVVHSTEQKTVVIYHYGAGGRIMTETDSSGKLIRDYIWMNGQAVAQIDRDVNGEHLVYLYPDHLMTSRLATDSTGTVVWSWEGEVFGNASATEDPDGDGRTFTMRIRFPGQYLDEETGWHYNWNRYYDPKIGRYITSDPIGHAGGLNLYEYASSNALRMMDPFGFEVYYQGNLLANQHVQSALTSLDSYLPGYDINVTGGDRTTDKKGDIYSISNGWLVGTSAEKSRHLLEQGAIAVDIQITYGDGIRISKYVLEAAIKRIEIDTADENKASFDLSRLIYYPTITGKKDGHEHLEIGDEFRLTDEEAKKACAGNHHCKCMSP